MKKSLRRLENYLKNTYKRLEKDFLKVDELTTKTYATQQHQINANETVSNILQEWPFLAMTKYLFKHYNVLLGIPYSLESLINLESLTKSTPVLFHSNS